VKVQFYWDRKGEHNDKSSCWVRVAQSGASGGFGSILIPRVGDEASSALKGLLAGLAIGAGAVLVAIMF
jgi:hypothetical protein